MPAENPNDQVTRADLEKQLEIHAKTIELQVLLSQQQEKILDKLESHEQLCEEVKGIVEEINKRTWKQNWLFWGLIFLMATTCISIVVELLT